MSFQTEIEKLARTRRAYLRFALAENSTNRIWTGPVDRRYGKVGDAQALVPISGTVVRFGTIQRSLANFLYALEVPSVSVELLDPDREWRALAGGFDDQLIYRNISFWLRVLDDTMAPLDERIAVAQIRKPTFPSGGRVALDCQVSSGNFLGEKIPRRFITTRDFANAPAEVQGLPVPIIYGVRYNNVLPFTIPPVEEDEAADDPLPGGSSSDDPQSLPPITGGETVQCQDLWADDFEGGAITGYASGAGDFTLAAGAGAGGTKALRPVTSAASELVKTVSPPRRAFCIEWSSDSDQTGVSAETYMVDGVNVYRVGDKDVSIEVPFVGQLKVLPNILLPGTRQTFRVEGAFATKNLSLPTTAPFTPGQTILYFEPSSVTRLRVGMHLEVGGEIVTVVSINSGTGGVTVTRAQYDGYAGGGLHYTGGAWVYYPQVVETGTMVHTYDTNGYLKFYLNGVLKYQLLNTDLVRSASDSGAWSRVALAPSGDGDNFHIGSGLTFTAGGPGVEYPASETSPYGGSLLNPSPTPECQPTAAGGGSPSGGAVRAILVGGYVEGAAYHGGTPGTPAIADLIDYIDNDNDMRATTRERGTGVNGRYSIAIVDPGAPNSPLTVTEGLPGQYTVELETDGDGNLVSRSIDVQRHPTLADNPYFWLDNGPEGGLGFGICATFPQTFLTGGTDGVPETPVDNLYVLAGHALKEVTDVYVLKPVIIQSFAPDEETGETRDPLRSEPVQVRQTEGTDYTQRILDINGNRYHVLAFVAAQVSETCEYFEVTANVKGVETNGDGTGTLLTNADDIFEHVMLNWVLNSYRSGPWFTDVSYAPGIWNHASVVTAKAVAAARLTGGYVGSGTLDEVVEAREWIRELLISYDLELFYNIAAGPAGAWSVSRFDPTVSRTSLPHFHASTDAILLDTFSSEEDVEGMVNVLPFFGGPTTERSGQNSETLPGGGGWKVSGEAKSSRSIGRFGMSIAEPVYLKWTDDEHTIIDVVGHYLRYLELPLVPVTFRSGLRALSVPPTSLLRLTHPDGIGSSAGWVEHVCKVIRNDIDLDRLVSTLQLVSVDRLMT